MRHALAILVALLLATTATAAPELTAGHETFIPAATWGGGAAINAAGRLLTYNSFEATYVSQWPNVERRVALPKWTPSGSWHDGPPAIAAGPSTFLVIWSETTNTTTSYLAIRLAADLTLLDARPIFLSATRRDRPTATPSAVWSGNDWVVSVGPLVTRINEQGVVTELNSIPSVSAVAASDDSVFVAYIGQQGFTHCGFNPQMCTFATFYVTGQFLRRNGVAVDGPRLTSAERYRTFLAAGGGSAGFIVASVVQPAFNAEGTITIATIGKDGVVHEERILDGTKNVNNTRVAFAGDGDRFLAAWSAEQAGGSVLRAGMLDAEGRPIGNTLLIGNRNEAAGPITLTRLSENRYLMVYSRGPAAGGAGLLVRELRYGGSGRTRAVR
ncbi:MAG TPA: hypothetical protein VGF48_22060 [Thermoanaerobaculia bacterium]|jgi:hypothetical protein